MTEIKPKILGITGTIASGKSLVGKILTEQGITVIDTDRLTHELLADDLNTKKAIVEQFGPQVLQAPSQDDYKNETPGELYDLKQPIDRKKLGAIVFKDAVARHKLEQIVHPNVILNCRRKVAALQGQPLVAVLAPLLFETNLANEYDEIWTVFTSEEVLRQRLADRDKLTQAEIEGRLAAQMAQSEKCQRAHQVIDNSGTEAETARQVYVLLDKLIPSQSQHH
jgi:dephospho-CoA kinase